MAVYQFLTYVLPKDSIVKEYGEVPKCLEIKHDEWERYWDNYDFKTNEPTEPNFQDAITIKWWKGIEVNIEELRASIDKILPRTSWSQSSWKIENGKVDHDVSIDFNEEEHFIEDFRFRTDLRDSSMAFLTSMLSLCSKNHWILMGENGTLCQPTKEEFADLIKNSNALKFLNNPSEFLDSIK